MAQVRQDGFAAHLQIWSLLLSMGQNLRFSRQGLPGGTFNICIRFFRCSIIMTFIFIISIIPFFIRIMPILPENTILKEFGNLMKKELRCRVPQPLGSLVAYVPLGKCPSPSSCLSPIMVVSTWGRCRPENGRGEDGFPGNRLSHFNCRA